jgi:hypothetical protein
MRYLVVLLLIATVAVSAQDRPNCTGLALDFDARCGCVKDPNSQLCALVKAGAYEPVDWSKVKPLNLTPNVTVIPNLRTAPSPPTQSIQPRMNVAPLQRQSARVVPLAHTDYLRFLHHDAKLAAGVNLGKVTQTPDIARALFGSTDADEAREKVNAALREVDRMWISFVPPGDLVVLMTGRFEGGVAAGLFYGRGVYPVFLGGAHAMMIGPESSMQAALARLGQPAGSGASTDGWVAKRAKVLNKDHEVWIVNQPGQTAFDTTSALKSVRQFAMGVRVSADPGIDGEAVADSDASAESIAQWMDRMKAATKALDGVTIERAGASLRFSAKDNAIDSTKGAMSSEFGMELYSVMMASFPGAPLRTVAQEKLAAVKTGMKKDDVVSLLGRPLTVTSIQGLETPRETWTYQIPFGKQVTLRLDDGAVSSTPR